LELNGTRIPNGHGFVAPMEIDISNGEPLLCVTPQSTCCSSAESIGGALPGNWYFPNGDQVSSNTSQVFYTTRGTGVIRLHRNRGGLGERPRGIFRCELPDQTGVNQTLYVGLYALTVETSGKRYTDAEYYLSMKGCACESS